MVLLEWLDPPFSCGHWSPQLVDLAGGAEVLGRAGEKSRTLRWAEVDAADPDVIIVACCGFDLARTQQDLLMLEASPQWQALTAVRNERVHVIDGSQYFSRPGPRLVDSLEILAHALHPDIHPLPAHLPRAVTLREIRDAAVPARRRVKQQRVLLAWSSGKDSAWALHVCRARGIEVVGLLTTMNEAADRVAMHAVRRELLEAQAEAAGLPLHTVALPWPCSNADYEQRMGSLHRACGG